MKKAILLLVISLALTTGAIGASSAETSIDETLSMKIRGVWIHPALFGTERDAALVKMQTTLDEYQQAGINTLIVLVKDTAGYVYYPSRIAVQHPQWTWDFFGTILAECRKRKIDVHPWFCVFHQTALLGKVREHPEWLITSPKGEMVGSVNPALPAARDYELSLMLEIAARYGVDWIHLDYIRFPCDPAEPYFSYDPETLRRFKEYSGVDLTTVKAHDSGNIIYNKWLEWNRAQVTQFVRDLKAALSKTGRSVKISAAVFPDADNAKVLIGQDWPAWARERLVDMLCPMLYTNHAGFFGELTRQAVEYGRGLCLVCPGIGIGTSHNQNTPDGMIEQMRISHAAQADGVIFFSGSSLNEPFLEQLKAAR